MLRFLVFMVYLTASFLDSKAITREEIDQFHEFKKNFNKIYESSTEEDQRMRIFLKNMATIDNHNTNFMKGISTYSMKTNEFADLSEDEFQRQFINGSIENDLEGEDTPFFSPPYSSSIPASIDWRVLGAVTPVKKQNKCGCCWAFSATGALEGQHFLKRKNLVSLSEQNLIDCTKSFGNNGCHGGVKERAFQYVIKNNGIATEESYPFEANDNKECRFENATIGTTSYSFVNVERNNETVLTAAVALNGPISVSVNAHCLKMQFYHKGIIDYDECQPRPLTHGMLIVGYGYDDVTAQNFWILKNSWGSNWGMDGYIHIPRFRNFAGIALKPSFPLV